MKKVLKQTEYNAIEESKRRMKLLYGESESSSEETI